LGVRFRQDGDHPRLLLPTVTSALFWTMMMAEAVVVDFFVWMELKIHGVVEPWAVEVWSLLMT